MKPHKPSGTARLIAAATLLSSIRGRSAEPVPASAALWCERLLAASPRGALLLALLRRPIIQAALSLVEQITIPGILRHYQLRKRWIERAWRQAQDAGFEQLLILGAGLDPLALIEASA